MTPREKAKNIYNRMLQWQDDCNIFIERNIISISAKQSALIAVQELIDQCHSHREIDLGMSLDYWNEVKKEIEKL